MPSRTRTLRGEVINFDDLIEKSKTANRAVHKNSEVIQELEVIEESRPINGFIPPEPKAPIDVVKMEVKGGGSKRRKNTVTKVEERTTPVVESTDNEKEEGEDA